MLVLIIAIAAFAFVLRRVYFSTLSKIPGPKLAALTSLYYTAHEFKGDRHLFVDKLHQQYGPMVRIGPNYISISDPAAIKEIYGVGSWDKPRGGWYTHFSAYGEDNMFSTWEGREHLKRKKVVIHVVILIIGHQFDVQEDVFTDELCHLRTPCQEYKEHAASNYTIL